MRWQSSDPRIADVAGDGTASGKRAGAALVSASVDAGAIRDAEAWGKLFQGELLYKLPWNAPPVDFSRYDVVALVDDRTTYGEGRATITHVAKDGSEVHVVFPGIQGPGLGSHRSTYLFLTGKLAPNATVRVHTLCDP